MTFISNFIDGYTIGYPIVMSLCWCLGSYASRLDYESKERRKKKEKVSIVISAYNEEKTIKGLLISLRRLRYPNLEIVIVDDKSTDQTIKKIEQVRSKFKRYPELKVIKKEKNEGKAQALNDALHYVTGKYMLVLDADSYLEKNAVRVLLNELTANKRNGAVTGRPVVRNRTTMLGKLQTLEYLNIIDNIKRSQSFLGAIMTVSGVIVMYRVEALKAIGGFNVKAMTEDIDVTWRLYQAGWQVRYSANALSYILVPERIPSLIKQRLRWSSGGLEVFISNFFWALRYGNLCCCFLMIEVLCSQIWSWLFLISTFRFVYFSMLSKEIRIPGEAIIVFLIATFGLFFVSSYNDRGKSYLSFFDRLVLLIYLFFYWHINLLTNIAAVVRLLTNYSDEGKWESPDRGV